MNLEQFYNDVFTFATECGMIEKKYNSKGNTVVRNIATQCTTNQQLIEIKAFFAFIREEEPSSEGYHDYSLVFFPQINEQKQLSTCVVALGVGSMGFLNDHDIASLPWIRRLFTKLRKVDSKSFYKNDFSDIDSPSADLFSEVKRNYPDLKAVIEKYKNYLPACQILEFDEGNYIENYAIIKQWIATYAYLRSWAGNKAQRKAIEDNIPESSYKGLSTEELYKIIKKDRYVVLQGAPGTGKTWNALKLASEKFNKGNVLFEQFHAETTYSDFIYGIRPVLDGKTLAYEPNLGILYNAIKQAMITNAPILLIIDEINRANLSNVLGPVFYLFEKKQSNRDYSINIGDISLSQLPENLYVIATMNTADRSLAVVDFALRRRFTWLTLKPHILDDNDFQKSYFEDIDALFQKYATADELNLQPGHSYFIAKDEEEMKDRLHYELMPLMKEYFNEGYLQKAKDEFSNYFYNKLGILMYE